MRFGVQGDDVSRKRLQSRFTLIQGLLSCQSKHSDGLVGVTIRDLNTRHPTHPDPAHEAIGNWGFLKLFLIESNVRNTMECSMTLRNIFAVDRWPRGCLVGCHSQCPQFFIADKLKCAAYQRDAIALSMKSFLSVEIMGEKPTQRPFVDAINITAKAVVAATREGRRIDKFCFRGARERYSSESFLKAVISPPSPSLLRVFVCSPPSTIDTHDVHSVPVVGAAADGTEL